MKLLQTLLIISLLPNALIVKIVSSFTIETSFTTAGRRQQQQQPLPILQQQQRRQTSIDNRQQQQQQQQQHNPTLYMTSSSSQIVSPFDSDNESSSSSSQTTTTKPKLPADIILDLTLENVEMVLDEMRPFLVQDGGNVIVKEIDGPVVKLELQGNCGTCPSSTQTMKMGLERGLKEKIPEIQQVIQSLPEGPSLCEDEINIVLNGVRPFLQIAGGTIDIDRLEGINGLQPTIWLHMQGSSASLNSVKLEIAQRLQRHFMLSGMQVQWK